MKNILVSLGLILTNSCQPCKNQTTLIDDRLVTSNLFIITTDGFRWQELFGGADSSLLFNNEYTHDTETIKALYWDSDAGDRRKKLLPFMWNVIAEKGQLFGNRDYDNKVNVSNNYVKSYPGYSEMLTGWVDPALSSNRKEMNKNITVLEKLNTQTDFTGKIAVFASWNVFPYILNEKRSGLVVNSGYHENDDASAGILNELERSITDKTETRYDELTYIAAREYLQHNNPRVLYLGLGETDEFAHQGRYDLYLQQANQVDKMIAELWHWVQTTPGYKDNTTFLITTDHGRGSKSTKWTSHGPFIKGSSQVWLAVLGPKIKPAGEIKEPGQLYLHQIARTIANLLGEQFDKSAPAISLIAH